MTQGEGFPLTGREIVLTAPLSEEVVRSLKVGDVVLIRGEMYTGRDAVHAHLMKNPPPVDLHGAVLYHCGPVMLQQGGRWSVKGAGPTTSIREEPYEADVIGKYGVRAVIGKGGMGPKTLAALQEYGAVYLNGIWGRGAVLCAHGGGSAGRESDGVRDSGSDVASAGEQLPGDRDDGRAWQQPACGCGKGDGGGVGAFAAGVVIGFWGGGRPCYTVIELTLVLSSTDGQIAQLVERSPEKAGVGGSIPSLATTF